LARLPPLSMRSRVDPGRRRCDCGPAEGYAHCALYPEGFGGGPGNVFSPIETIQRIGRIAQGAPPVAFAEARPSDQLYYVSDTRKFQKLTGWKPRVAVKEGVAHLHAWLKANRSPRQVERREAAG
jgi:nucleoside-diphosphate-sugar epimerase